MEMSCTPVWQSQLDIVRGQMATLTTVVQSRPALTLVQAEVVAKPPLDGPVYLRF